jgi:Lrp/AsnC family transcriptional regulator for asnA, asnC and gidA
MLAMDKLDRKIIREIRKNARQPFSRIAKNLGVSTQTIIRRYNEMKTNGTIALSAISINLEKVGYRGTAHILIKSKPDADPSQIVEHLRKIPNIITASRTIGSYDAYAVLAFRDIADLYNNVMKIRELPELVTVNVSFGMPGTKYFPPKK